MCQFCTKYNVEKKILVGISEFNLEKAILILETKSVNMTSIWAQKFKTSVLGFFGREFDSRFWSRSVQMRAVKVCIFSLSIFPFSLPTSLLFQGMVFFTFLGQS